MTLNWLVLSSGMWRNVRRYIVSWFEGIAGFVFMVEVVITDRCISVSGFKMNCIRK